MQELEILNMTIEKLDVDPATPGEGRVWFSNGTKLPKIRANGQNRFLVAPDDDFNFTLPLKGTLYEQDTLLIFDFEHTEYRRIKASVILSQMSTVKDVFKTIHSEYGIKDIVASGADELYFAGDGVLLKTVGNDIGSKQVKYDLRDQAINSVLAGPLDVTMGKPTFRHLTDGDLPASYNPDKWNTAVDFTQITTGNPTNVTMLDLGYTVVTTIGDPGLDENLPTEKATRVAIGLAIAALIDSSPGVLDTLNEIAAALGDDPNFATTITTLISGKEPALGNPSVSGYYLSSTTSGVRSWQNIPDPFVTSVVSDILSATVLAGMLSVVPYALANKADGRLYWGVTDPTNTKRLNYDGYFYATKLYIGGSEVIAGGTLYTNASATPQTLGGIAAGSTFSNQSMQQMWDSFLYPYQVPTLYSFAITGVATSYECGTVISGTKTFTWGSTNSGNINTNSIVIRDETGATDLVTGSANDGTEALAIGSITKNTTGQTQQWSITAVNSHSAVLTKVYFTVTFYNPFYYGVGAAAFTVANINNNLGGTRLVVAKSNKTLSFSPTSQKFYFCYPASYGYLTSIKDPNGFDITSSFTPRTVNFVNDTNFLGTTTSYYVYESNSLTTQTGFAITFNF